MAFSFGEGHFIMNISDRESIEYCGVSYQRKRSSNSSSAALSPWYA
jgi:hypothetical protein